jgi:hypothetical protein
MKFTESVTIEISPEDFESWDLIRVLERRGYEVDPMHRASECATNDLLNEVENRGYRLIEEEPERYERICQLHRIGSPLWETEALELIYELAGKVV